MSRLSKMMSKVKGGSKNKKRTAASVKADKDVKALHPGKRISESGNEYTETRPNRSDKDRRKKFESGGEAIDSSRIDEVLQNYVAAALWSSSNTDDYDIDEDVNLDRDYGIEDIDPALLAQWRSDIERFLKENDADIKEAELTDDQVGHSLWLSQNGHGAGFFDYSGEAADRLHEAAQKLGSVDLYVQDGKILSERSGLNKREYAAGGKLDDNEMIIAGIKHTKMEGNIPFNEMSQKGSVHPLGDVYAQGKYGYVANGYDWYQFELKDLPKLTKARTSGKYARGGHVTVTSINDIPNLQGKVDAGKVTYRGLGLGKLADDFYKASGTNGVRIKVDGKEYFITDEDFRILDWDFENGKWLNKIKFDAPHRKQYAKGGIPDNYKGKTAEQVWDAWTKEQRIHFIEDHFNSHSFVNSDTTRHPFFHSLMKFVDSKFENIPDVPVKSALDSALYNHTEHGQYAKGGKISSADELIQKFSGKISSEQSIKDFFQGLYDIDVAFHPDDDFNDIVKIPATKKQLKKTFTKKQADALNKIMEDSFAWCSKHDKDIYLIGLATQKKEFKKRGIMEEGGSVKQISASEEGNWVDGSRGIYQGEAIISIAESYGFQVKPEDELNKKSDGEFYYELVDEAVEYMNTLAPDGYYFGNTESGDFGLWKNDDKEYAAGGKINSFAIGDLVWAKNEGHAGLTGLVVSKDYMEDGDDEVVQDIYFRGLSGAIHPVPISELQDLLGSDGWHKAIERSDISMYESIAKRKGIKLNPKYTQAMDDDAEEFATGGPVYSEDIKEAKKLAEAFYKKYKETLSLPDYFVSQIKEQDHLSHGAKIFISSSVSSSVDKLKVGETKPERCYISVSSDINPAGVGDGRKPDVGRTYVISIEIKGPKRYTQRSTEDGVYCKFWGYSRTIDGVMKEVDDFVSEKLIPLIKEDSLEFSYLKEGHYARGGQPRPKRTYVDTSDDKLVSVKERNSSNLKTLHNGRYLTLATQGGKLHIFLTDEGREWIKENGAITYQNVWELFEDIAGNSEILYYDNLGEAGFGLTDAPGITDGYYHNDEGELVEHELGGNLWYYNDYAIKDPWEELTENGEVDFDGHNENKYAAGGKTSGKSIGIDFQSEFSSNDRDIIKDLVHERVSEMVEQGYTSGELFGEMPDFKGWFKVSIQKDEHDEDERNAEIANKIRDGYTSGYYPTFSFSANVWKEDDEKPLSKKNKYARGGAAENSQSLKEYVEENRKSGYATALIWKDDVILDWIIDDEDDYWGRYLVTSRGNFKDKRFSEFTLLTHSGNSKDDFLSMNDYSDAEPGDEQFASWFKSGAKTFSRGGAANKPDVLPNDDGDSLFAEGGMLKHGFYAGDKILQIYKGYGIVENMANSKGGVIEVINPNEGTRFIIDLDDSKRTGHRRSFGMNYDEQIESAKKYIDYLTRTDGQPRFNIMTEDEKRYDGKGVTNLVRFEDGGQATNQKTETMKEELKIEKIGNQYFLLDKKDTVVGGGYDNIIKARQAAIDKGYGFKNPEASVLEKIKTKARNGEDITADIQKYGSSFWPDLLADIEQSHSSGHSMRYSTLKDVVKNVKNMSITKAVSEPRIPNTEAQPYVENCLAFKGSNLEGKITDNGDYMVLSFGHYPIWYYNTREKKWYGNNDKYCQVTAMHISQTRPNWDAEILSHKALLDKMRTDESKFAAGGSVMLTDMIDPPLPNLAIASDSVPGPANMAAHS